MKKIILLSISFYQVVLSSLLHQLTGTKNACRFSPTCSEYAKISISNLGIIKGTYTSFIRIIKCQPFYSKAV